MLQATQKVGGGVLWANLHLLFWLSLVPFVTGWMGESHFDVWPVACYGAVLLGAAIAYTIFQHLLTKLHGSDPVLAKASGTSTKERVSLVLYAPAIPLALVNRWISCALFVTVAVIWLIPDRRIVAAMRDRQTGLFFRPSRRSRCPTTLLPHHLAQARPGDIDPLLQFLGIQSADRVFHHQQLGIDLAGLGLRQNQRTEGISGDHIGRDANLFEFDAVVETPR